MMKSAILFAFLVSVFSLSAESMMAQETAIPAALNFEMTTIDGKKKSLADYRGKVVVIVNVASRCGLTPQYEKLQSLHDSYSEKGLAILGFPCNQFRGQEPGTNEEIKAFCVDNYDVAFDLFSKIEVNGDGRCELYKHLTSLDIEPAGTGDIAWNFEKFVLDREGNVVARFGPRQNPQGDEMIGVIKKALEDK